MVVCPSGEKVPHQDLLQDTVKGRLGIEEEGEDGKVGDIKGVMDCLCEDIVNTEDASNSGNEKIEVDIRVDVLMLATDENDNDVEV